MMMRLLALFVLAGSIGIGCGEDTSSGEGGATSAGDVLSQAEISDLIFTREEEKLARDVYTALEAQGQPFTNVKASEQTHMDAIGALLTTYGLPDPVAGRDPGEFEDAALQGLYAGLVEAGAASATSALAVGCEIEELDIRDIEVAAEHVTHADILATYDNLLLGSRNHLRAFHEKLTAAGGTYAPKYIDQAAFDAIVSSAHEKP